jgi:hypothetical protein
VLKPNLWISYAVEVREDHKVRIVDNQAFKVDVCPNIPAWAYNDPQMEEIHTDCAVRQAALVHFRTVILKHNPQLALELANKKWNVTNVKYPNLS